MIGKHNYKATLYRVLKIDEADARRVKGRGRAERSWAEAHYALRRN